MMNEQSHNSVTESREERSVFSKPSLTGKTDYPTGMSIPIRTVLAQNLQALMDLHRERGNADLASRQRVSKTINESKAVKRRFRDHGRASLSPASIDNVLWELTAISIDNLEKIALVFDIPAYYLLVPGLDLRNPPVQIDPDAVVRLMTERSPQLARFFDMHGGLNDLEVGQEGMAPYGSTGANADGNDGTRLPKRGAKSRRRKKAGSK